MGQQTESSGTTRRKFLGASAASLAGTVFLAACGGSDSAGDTKKGNGEAGDSAPGADSVELNYWYWADTPEHGALTTDALDKFSADNDKINVNYDEVPTFGETQQKLSQSFAADAGMPDISMVSGDWLTDFEGAGMVVGLDDRVKSWETSKDWLEAIPETTKSTPDSQAYMITNQLLVGYMYYRQDWFAEAGLEPPDSQDDLQKVATELHDAPNRFGFGLRGGDRGGLIQQAGHFLKGNGVEIIAEDGTVDMDSDAAVDTITWWTELQNVSQPSAVSDTFVELLAAFEGGKLAMLPHGIWSWVREEGELGDSASATPVPRGSERRFVSMVGEGNSVFTSSENQDQAWEVAAYMGEVDQVRAYSHKRGTAPMLASMLDDEIYENRFYQAILTVQDDWGQYPTWHPNWVSMLEAWGPEIQRTFNGETTPAEFCTAMAEVLREG